MDHNNSKHSSKNENKEDSKDPKSDLGVLEEDDEFEEFPTEGMLSFIYLPLSNIFYNRMAK